jgi:hypothetical protein
MRINVVDFILDTFPVLQRGDKRAYGEYRTKRVVLELYDAFIQTIDSNKSYVSPLL